MTTCKQLEELHTDYVCDLLDNERLGLMEGHLQNCPACVQAVESLKKVLSLTEEVRAISIPDPILNNLEVNVYKRLVVESSQPVPMPFFSRVFEALCSAWNWRIAVACCILAVSIPVASIIFNQDRSADAPLRSVHIPSPQERVEQYKQQQIKANLDDALVAMYLRD
jgi:anti-sigma factor RsiW